ncbi:UDP-glucuronat epimerase [Capsaspora owczarzaki ATCC 30864]|uniref:UDP-glucuronat epimerase n=1 Tax=Capsaspora owczarzaki (strain ATCC 30864) TaxID=595528 RepID=A0A0D2UK32_CAPO3|nr:UDP-glucuronat epimerase [Capsaspora owczarzaki ATCC 30864]
MLPRSLTRLASRHKWSLVFVLAIVTVIGVSILPVREQAPTQQQQPGGYRLFAAPEDNLANANNDNDNKDDNGLNTVVEQQEQQLSQLRQVVARLTQENARLSLSKDEALESVQLAIADAEAAARAAEQVAAAATRAEEEAERQLAEAKAAAAASGPKGGATLNKAAAARDPSKPHRFDDDDSEAGTYNREATPEEIGESIRADWKSFAATHGIERTLSDAVAAPGTAAATAARDSAELPKRILVTGAAGFVGYHTSIHLKTRGDFVFGLDNLNSYYDPRLKVGRMNSLKELDVRVITGDVCDAELLRSLFSSVDITHVVHLAAQAGVRYSLDHPLAYIRANVKCFITLLEVCFHTKERPIKTVYASSSSVYGLNTKQPFSETDQVDMPASLYAATKKSNEGIAHVYHHLHKLPLTGLRFFTVYGPFGRPDMAYYSFTASIVADKPITVYKNDDGSEMMRDFTFVSDIVAGITACVDLGAELEVFNLGNNNPEKLSTLINLIEKGLGREAEKIYAPITAGDVPSTFADVSHSKKMLGYEPKVSLEKGISIFLDWYAKFHNLDIPGLQVAE